MGLILMSRAPDTSESRDNLNIKREGDLIRVCRVLTCSSIKSDRESNESPRFHHCSSVYNLHRTSKHGRKTTQVHYKEPKIPGYPFTTSLRFLLE